MAAPMHAAIPPAPYDAGKERWASYIRRFNLFLRANAWANVPEEQKLALFLTHCGPEVFEAAENVAAPEAPEDLDWDDLQTALADHFEPAESSTAHRFEFRDRIQLPGESINKFVSELRKKARLCAFGDVDVALRDQIIFGVQDKDLQKRLLKRKNQTLAQTIEEARANEISNQAANSLKRMQLAPRGKEEGIHFESTAQGSLGSSDEEVLEEMLPSCHKTVAAEPGIMRNKMTIKCKCCGALHPSHMCKFKDVTCRRCQKMGHLARVCRAPYPSEFPPIRGKFDARKWPRTQAGGYPGKKKEDTINVVRIGHAVVQGGKKEFITVKIENRDCQMEIDTGASLTIMSWSQFKRIRPKAKRADLSPTSTRLIDCQGHALKVWGLKWVAVEFEGENEFKGTLPLIIADGKIPCLLGMDWFAKFGLHIGGRKKKVAVVNHLSDNPLISEFQDVFSEELGRYVGTPISLNLDPAVPPVRLKPRRVPLPLKPKVDAALDKLIAQGVLTPTDHSNWETPIVTPMKPDGSIRICGDYKCTINRAIKANSFPVPVIQHLLHSLGPGNVFAKLDMAQAYQQLPVSQHVAEVQTIITHRGAFKCNRLQFGVNAAPGIFQALMERLLTGLPGVVPYFDDILISADSRQQLQERVKAVLLKFRAVGLKLKAAKCIIGAPEVHFLGYRINKLGIFPIKDKVRAIQDAPQPKSKQELQAFLGLLNFYSVFLKGKATVAEPLHKLLRKREEWHWGKREQEAFAAVKNLLSEERFLMQYSMNLPVALCCDASPFGVGAVLSHVLPDGREIPIAYYSRSLSAAEKNYGHIDKEALAIVAAVKKFHDYLYGRKFHIFTDHRPLLGLLSGSRPTPASLPPRFVRWTLFMAGYDYELHYRPGSQMGHADALSRCPLLECVEDPADKLPVFSINYINTYEDLSSKIMAKETKKDPILSKICNSVLKGWPVNESSPELKPFRVRKDELSVLFGVLLWGDRVVVPVALRQRVLQLLHDSHQGVVKMKGLARGQFWWPGLDKGIIDLCAACSKCRETQCAPNKMKPAKWERPHGPWQRIHIDFAGPLQGHMLLIVVDAYSKWVEIQLMKSTNSESVIATLRRIFVTHGLPDVLVSDNGPQFTSREFEQYLASVGVRHALTAPFNPKCNGMAERTVQTVKRAILKMDTNNWQERVDTFLAWQHVTPGGDGGISPAEMLMGRKLRSPMDRANPRYDPLREHEEKQEKRIRELEQGEKACARNYASGPKWVKGTVTSQTGPRSYEIRLEDGRTWKRHIDQLRRNLGKDTEETVNTKNVYGDKTCEKQPEGIIHNDNTQTILPTGSSLERNSDGLHEQAPIEETVIDDPETVGKADKEGLTSSPVVDIPLRRSTRVKREPVYLKDFVR